MLQRKTRERERELQLCSTSKSLKTKYLIVAARRFPFLSLPSISELFPPQRRRERRERNTHTTLYVSCDAIGRRRVFHQRNKTPPFFRNAMPCHAKGNGKRGTSFFLVFFFISFFYWAMASIERERSESNRHGRPSFTSPHSLLHLRSSSSFFINEKDLQTNSL